MTTLSSLVAAKRLGGAVGSTDLAILLAAKDGSGNAAPLAVGQRTKSASQSIVLASDDDLLAAVRAEAKRFLITGTPLIRPISTTAYSQNDSISDNATAGSVTPNPVTISDTNGAPVTIFAVRLETNDTAFATATIRMHLFNADPTLNSGVGSGDNDAAGWLNKRNGYVGSLVGYMTKFSDGAVGVLIPETPMDVVEVEVGGKRIWWQLQILGSSAAPTASSTFTPTFKGRQLAAA